MSVDCDRGVVLAIVPLKAVGLFDDPFEPGAGWSGFEEIDPDVDLPSRCFRGIKQRAVPIGDRSQIQIPPKAARAGMFGDDTPEKPGADAELRRLRIIVVDPQSREGSSPGGSRIRWKREVAVSPSSLRSEFLVAEVAPIRSEESCLVDLAKALSSDRAAGALAERVDRAPLHSDTRASVLVVAYADGGIDGRVKLAGHLATRAPFGEELWKTDGTGVKPLSDHHVRFVTPRVSGFVADATGSSDFFENKFVPEVRMQYTLAQVLTVWQRIWMDELLSGVQDAWSETNHSKGLVRSRSSHDRLERLRVLRNQHAVLIASGTFSPVFESGSQLEFWEEFQKVHGIAQRRQELDEALQALAEAAEIEASVNLERLLAFFTLVVGVPSLVFAVLGVNISRVTSDTGVSFLLVLLLVALCLLVGAAVYLLASGRGASSRALRLITQSYAD